MDPRPGRSDVGQSVEFKYGSWLPFLKRVERGRIVAVVAVPCDGVPQDRFVVRMDDGEERLIAAGDAVWEAE
jgi:hypothetical protein